jgi:hypothetical protein
LQEVGEGIDLGGQLAQRVLRAGSARAEGVVALAKRCNHIRESLQGADHTFNERGSHQQQVDEQAACEQKSGGETERIPIQKNCGEDQRGQRQQKAVAPSPADRRAPAPAYALFIGHIFQCGDREPSG